MHNTQTRMKDFNYIQQSDVLIVHPRLRSLDLFAVFPFLSHSVTSLVLC